MAFFWFLDELNACVFIFVHSKFLAQNEGHAEFEVTNPQIKHYRLTKGISVLFISSLWLCIPM
jgi:hypothetical protein